MKKFMISLLSVLFIMFNFLCASYAESVNSVANNIPIISLQSITFNFEHSIYALHLKNSSPIDANNLKIYTAYYSNDGALLDLKSHNIYNLRANDELTTFMPINDLFDSCTNCKLMIWNDKMQPMGEATTIKEFSYDKNMTVPENKKMIFSDVPIDHKYYDVIYIMHNQELNAGMFNGYEDGTYKPDGHMLKSEFAYSLVKMMGIQIDKINVDCSLKDVSSSHWCKNAIGFLISNSITDTEDGFFYPNNKITTNEILASFLKALGEENITNDTIMLLANQHNLLTNANINELEITRGNFTQIAYNFMNEYYN